jgi:MmyB-like transcription regulator ligand binding domain
VSVRSPPRRSWSPGRYIDWERAANDVVSVLRSAAGRDPHDRDLSDLVGELSTKSDEFRTRWAAHNVRFHDTGTKDFHHPWSATSPSPTTGWTSPPTPDKCS